MTFITKLSFQSGDRYVLEKEVSNLKTLLEKKGAECKGPHADPPKEITVPQYRYLAPGDQFNSWQYTVYARHLEIHGNDHIAREVGHMDFPDSIHVEIELEQRKPAGHRQS
jgi:ribosomal protein S10